MKKDSEIHKHVVQEILWSPSLKGSEINVAVKNGVVVLTGVVDSYYKKIIVEKAIKKINGVKALVEELEVNIPDRFLKGDLEIADAILYALKWNSAVDEAKIQVTVEKGLVILEGEVEWNFEKVAIRKTIENISGVREIVNNIRVKNRVVAQDVSFRIAEAFTRHATIDSNKINVEVVGDKVILTGQVRSWAEKQDAEKTAWSSPGVLAIENRLEIVSESILY